MNKQNLQGNKIVANLLASSPGHTQKSGKGRGHTYLQYVLRHSNTSLDFINITLYNKHIVQCSLVPRLSVGGERESLVHTVCACVSSPQDMGTLGYFLILPCYVTSEFGLDIVYLAGYYNGV